VLLLCLTSFSLPAWAQQALTWVQIEAHPSLATAQQRASAYARLLRDVNGFSLGRGWYGIVLGPYTRPDAERVLQVYKADRQIPQDSFITFPGRLGQQFWPLGIGNAQGPVTPAIGSVAPQVQENPAPVELKPADETPAEARRSESRLTRDDRKLLQTALQSAGFYAAAIDGAFGRGTRGSMRAWQEARGYEPTGVLTTLQRKALIDEYNAPLIEVGMAEVVDTRAGIAIQMPTKEVAFSRYESPFAHYDTAGSVGARVVLISQPGTQATLYGLYDIMQTLEIVPVDGPRERGRTGFMIEGRGDGIVAYTEAALEQDQIKGFTLVWPDGDEARRTRVLEEMKKSYRRLDGVLDPSVGADAEQRVDLVSGLTVRKPRLSRSGFFIDGGGAIVTTVEAVQNCSRITIDQDYEAVVVSENRGLGVAVLRPATALAPMSVARFRDGVPRLKSDVAVSGYSYEGTLGAPSLTFGTLSDIRGLQGEQGVKRLALATLPGDVGGPVFDAGGGVVGMLLPNPDTGRVLPEDVRFAASGGAIAEFVGQAGLNVSESPTTGTMDPVDLGRMARGMTVLVSCWN
jgi:peptidoglycan hydrolase-like protein with peptidoglycan-binding domain